MKILKNEALAPFTTVKIGGSAQTLIITDTIQEFIKTLQKTGPSDLFILGNGSNILISDRGIPATVIKNNSQSVEYLDSDLVKVDSGVQLPWLINDTISHSLSGLEEFAYIPSSIGGAIYGNIHGVNKSNFDKFVRKITVFNRKTQTVEELDSQSMSWDYDFSEFKKKPHLIILSALLQLTPGNKNLSQQQVKDIIAKKILSQSMNSLGSTFKNPPGDAAGRIIDQELNLKGYRIGDAQISPKHANFILNLGQATATDYKAVIDHVIQTAKTKLNLTLEPEIIFWGQF